MNWKNIIATDKVAHFGASFFITALVSCFFVKNEWCISIGVIVAIISGIGKELYDIKKGGEFDLYDFFADLFGIFAAVLVLMPYIFYIFELEKLLGR